MGPRAKWEGEHNHGFYGFNGEISFWRYFIRLKYSRKAGEGDLSRQKHHGQRSKNQTENLGDGDGLV